MLKNNEEMEIVSGECSEESREQNMIFRLNTKSLKELLELSQKQGDEGFSAGRVLNGCFVAEYTKTIVPSKTRSFGYPKSYRSRWRCDNDHKKVSVVYRFYVRHNDVLFTRSIPQYGNNETFVYAPGNEEEAKVLITVINRMTTAGSFDGWNFDFIQFDFLKYLRIYEGLLKTGDIVEPCDFKRFMAMHDSIIDTVTVKLLPNNSTGEVKEFEFECLRNNYAMLVTVK